MLVEVVVTTVPMMTRLATTNNSQLAAMRAAQAWIDGRATVGHGVLSSEQSHHWRPAANTGQSALLIPCFWRMAGYNLILPGGGETLYNIFRSNIWR
jgi:hypothetical protein